MLVKEIKAVATALGIKTAKLKKAELIRAIQAKEGNFDCYGTAWSKECDQADCKWRADCFKESIAA